MAILLIKDGEDHGLFVQMNDVQRWFNALKELATHSCTNVWQGAARKSCREETADLGTDPSTAWMGATAIAQAIASGSLWCYSCKAKEALGVPLPYTYDI